jgi:hypothetical protein
MYNECIQGAVDRIATGVYPSIAAAARKLKVGCLLRLLQVTQQLTLMLKVAHQTLSDRVNSTHKSQEEANFHNQLLNNTEENVLLDWCDHLSVSATPLGPMSLCTHAFIVSGKHPGRNRHTRFSKHHKSLKLTKHSGLDLKHMQNFNRATVKHYFDNCK